MKKVELEVKKAFKFSFNVPKLIAPNVINLAFAHEVDTSYQKMKKDVDLTTIKGIGFEKEVSDFVSNIGALMQTKVELMDFLHSFKYKESEMAQPVPIPFAELEVKKVSNKIEK